MSALCKVEMSSLPFRELIREAENGSDSGGSAPNFETLAKDECAGQQADGVRENMESQEREPHAFTSFQHWPLQL